MAPEDGSVLHILSKWNGKAGLLPLHIHAICLSWLTSAYCWGFFPPRTLFLSSAFFLSLSFHFHFSFSIIEYFPSFSLFPIASLSFLLICAIPSPSRRGGEPTWLFSKTMVDPPSSFRLLLNSLLEGRRGKRSSSWCKWTRSSQVTSSPPLYICYWFLKEKFLDPLLPYQ